VSPKPQKGPKLRLFAKVAGLEGCRFGSLALPRGQHSTHVPNRCFDAFSADQSTQSA
jgi:hypothetical protein